MTIPAFLIDAVGVLAARGRREMAFAPHGQAAVAIRHAIPRALCIRGLAASLGQRLKFGFLGLDFGLDFGLDGTIGRGFGFGNDADILQLQAALELFVLELLEPGVEDLCRKREGGNEYGNGGDGAQHDVFCAHDQAPNEQEAQVSCASEWSHGLSGEATAPEPAGHVAGSQAQGRTTPRERESGECWPTVFLGHPVLFLDW